jgi:hypothetical protein
VRPFDALLDEALENWAAVIDPPSRGPTFFTSAICESIIRSNGLGKRHPPQLVAALLARLEQLVGKLVVGREQAAELVAQADQSSRRSEWRGRHRARLVIALHVGDRIGENEPPFGVGVDHLDRLARHGGDHVARPLGVARRHVLDKPQMPTTLAFALRPRAP